MQLQDSFLYHGALSTSNQAHVCSSKLYMSDNAQRADDCLLAQVDQIVSLRSEALQLQESLRLALLDKAEGEGQLQILKDKIDAKSLEGERSVIVQSSASL